MSHIVKHGWNGFPISQVVSDFNVQGQSLKAGSTSLTEIAKANGKNVHEFLRLPTIQRWSKAYKDRYGIFPYQTFRGGDMGTWGVLPLAVKMCSWISTDLELWADETIVKVATGQEITNADRAEGWTLASQLGLNLEVEPQQPIESDVSPELADSFRKTEWVIRKALELGTSAEEVQKIFLNFESAKPKPKPDRTPNTATKIKEASAPKSPHYHLVKEWFAECLEIDRDSSVQMGADRDIPSQLYGSFSKFLINKGRDQQISHSAFSATLKEFVGLELKSNPSIRFKSPNNKRTLYGVRLR